MTSNLFVGQNVWVTEGRQLHAAVISSLPSTAMAGDGNDPQSPAIRIKWSTMGTFATVGLNRIMPMHKVENGFFVSCPVSVRNKKKPTRYSPFENQDHGTKSTKEELNSENKTKPEVTRGDCSDSMPPKRLNTKGSTQRKFQSKKSVSRKITPKKRSLQRPVTTAIIRGHSNNLKQVEEESLDGASEISAKIDKYRSLCRYYLHPVKRENEELPNGMKLRKRSAPCNLLRFGSSTFRKKLHAEILKLGRLGNKAEILRILEEMEQHDMKGSVTDGRDGPDSLMEKILPRSYRDDENTLISVSKIKPKTNGNQMIDVDAVMNTHQIPTPDRVTSLLKQESRFDNHNLNNENPQLVASFEVDCGVLAGEGGSTKLCFGVNDIPNHGNEISSHPVVDAKKSQNSEETSNLS